MAMDWATLGMSGILSPPDSKNVPQSLRQRIALAMLMKQNKYPKTFGEGLSAIGDAIGERGMVRDLYGDAARSEAAGTSAVDRLLNPDATDGGVASPPVSAVRSSYAPPDTNVETPTDPRPTALATPPTQFPQSGLAPATPLPADETPGGTGLPGSEPYRMPSPAAVQDSRNALPRPPVVAPPLARQSAAPPVVTPPQQPPLPPATRPAALPPDPALDAVWPPTDTFRPPVFNDRFNASRPGQQSSLEPPPGTPVMAAGNEPSAEERDTARNALTQALMQRFGAQPGQQPPVPPASAPPAAMPPPGISQAPPPPQAAIRAAPPPQATPVGAGYVPEMKTEPAMPPTMTPLMQRMAATLRATPPGDREAVERNFAPLVAQEQAKITAAHEQWKLDLAHVRTHNESVEAARRDQQGRIDTSNKAQLEMPTAVPPAAPTNGPDPRLGTPNSPQRDGRPSVDPVPPGAVPMDWAKNQQKQIETDKASLEAAKPELRETLDLIKKVREHPAAEASMGLTGGLAKLTPSGQGFAKLNEQLMGKNLVAAYQKIKGTGPVGQQEGENISKAQSALSTSTTIADYNSALNTLETTLRGATERLERKLHQPVTAYQYTPNDPVAPDIGQIDATWKDGKAREYIGGDPRDKANSWKIVR